MNEFEAVRDGYEISDARARLDLDVVHGFLTRAYWSPGISRDLVARAIDNSLCFGLYRDGVQVGFARFVTDRATFAYLADVFVLPEHRGRGLASWMVGRALLHPALGGLRRVLLATRNQHNLYARLGFGPLARPERFMEIHNPDAYAR